MTHEESRVWLIEKLKNEIPVYRKIPTPPDEQGQKDMLRSLMNVRPASPAGEEFCNVQDAYLKREAILKGIVDVDSIPPCENDPDICIWQGDITRIKAGAVVNAANSQMLGCFIPMHACIDNFIHTYAGVQLRYDCSENMRMLRLERGDDYEQPTSIPMLTDAYNLPADKVIHIVGPIVQYGLTEEHEKALEDCYTNILTMCDDNGINSVAFCCISTGVFSFPNKRAAEIAVQTVRDYKAKTKSDIKVVFNVFKDIDLNYYRELLG